MNVAENILDPWLLGYTETGTPYKYRVMISQRHAAELGRLPINPPGTDLVLNIRYFPAP